MSMSDESSIDIEIAISISTDAEHSRSNQKIKEFLGAGSIDSIERSIVHELYDPEAEVEEDEI